MQKSHNEGHHKGQRNRPAKPARPRDKEYVNQRGHGVGARPASMHGAGLAWTRPRLDDATLNTDYRRPPCLDEYASYHYWLCDRTACRAGECDAWCESERITRKQCEKLLKAISELAKPL